MDRRSGRRLLVGMIPPDPSEAMGGETHVKLGRFRFNMPNDRGR